MALFNLAFGSCNNNAHSDIWHRIEQAKPDRLILLGDTMYSDHQSSLSEYIQILRTKLQFNATHLEAAVEDIQREYQLLQKRPSFQSMVRQIGGWTNIGAIFDDHDFGINNAHGQYEHKAVSQQLFWDFSQVPKDDIKRKQSGVYSSMRFSVPLPGNWMTEDGPTMLRGKIVLLDIRSNRDPPVSCSWFSSHWFSTMTTSPSSRVCDENTGWPLGDFLGDEQWTWLEQEMKDSDVDLLVLGSSIPVLSTDKIVEESWHLLPYARERLLRMIMKDSPAPNVVIISGDIHYSEISQARCTGRDGVSQQLYEFTSSGFSHTFTMNLPDYNSDSTTLPGDDQEGNSNSDQPHHDDLSHKSAALLKKTLFNFYQATFASRFREQRYGHFYQGPNFGMLRILADNPCSSSSSSSRSSTNDGNVSDSSSESETCPSSSSASSKSTTTTLSLEYQVIDHRGETKITKSIPLQYTRRKSNSLDLNDHQTVGQSQGETATCLPIWGEQPFYREFLYKVFFVGSVLFVVLLPFVTVSLFLWYLIVYLLQQK